MKRMSSHTIGMDQGTLELFSDFQDGGEMWTGSGPRKVSRAVEFSEAFTAQPMVQVSGTWAVTAMPGLTFGRRT
jgi:hypothetical protein